MIAQDHGVAIAETLVTARVLFEISPRAFDTRAAIRAPALRFDSGHRLAAFVRQTEQIGEQRERLCRAFFRLQQQCFELLQPCCRQVFARNSRGPFQVSDERMKRAVAMMR